LFEEGRNLGRGKTPWMKRPPDEMVKKAER